MYVDKPGCCRRFHEAGAVAARVLSFQTVAKGSEVGRAHVAGGFGIPRRAQQTLAEAIVGSFSCFQVVTSPSEMLSSRQVPENCAFQAERRARASQWRPRLAPGSLFLLKIHFKFLRQFIEYCSDGSARSDTKRRRSKERRHHRACHFSTTPRSDVGQ